MSKRNLKTNMSLEMTEEIQDVLGLDALLADLNMEPEHEASPSGIEDILGEIEIEAAMPAEDDLEAAAASAELETNKAAIYAEQPAGDEMNMEEDAAVIATEKPTKVAKEKKPKVAKEPKAPKEKKEPAYSMIGKKVSEVMTHMLGANIGDFLIFEMAEASLSAEERDALVADRIASFDVLPVKAQNKLRYIFDTLANGKPLQEYVRRGFACLEKEGEITTGIEGNYVKAMTVSDGGQKPFASGTALSQVAQFQTLFPFLGICTKEKGKLILNPTSTIFMAMKPHIAL